MKRLLAGILLTFTIIKLILSCATREHFLGASEMNSRSGIVKGTTSSDIPVKIDTFHLDILPPSLGVQFYRDGIVFLSLSKNEEKMLPGHISFGNVQAYYSVLQDATLGQHGNFSPSSSFPYPCEALSFTNDFSTMYFTRISEIDKREKIYHAEFSSSDNDWSIDTEQMSFCTKGSIYTHPAVSADGNIMIFASNNPKSIGGMDLFITKKVRGQWIEPKNLGIAINTEGNELFPFLDSNNNLFFSSDGHTGIGGYDIYICKFNGNSWDIPLNLTKNINSQNDEIAFTMDRIKGSPSFFTVRQKSRKDEIQLYRLTANDELNNDSAKLSKVLYSLALSEIDSNEVRKIMGRLEAERIKTDKIKTDSIEAIRIENERAKAAKMEADNTEKARFEAERIRFARMKEDSIQADRIYKERLKTGKDSAEAERIKEQQADVERIKAERIKSEKLKADSIETARRNAARLEAERIKSAKLKADSVEAARLEALRREGKGVVIYKVQILSTIKPRGNFEVIINGEKYTALEYLYLGEYRYTIGVFYTLDPAKKLQNICRKSGYPQAFVAAFKDGVRSSDIVLFK
jgi:hypothetical protein